MFFTNFLRKNVWAAAVLTVLRVYVGWHFLTAGWDKLTGGFSANGFLANAVKNPVMQAHSKTALQYPVYHSFLQHFALPNAGLFNFIVPWGEFLVGIGLITGVLTTAAMFFGLVMNFSYMMAGVVSVNPLLVLLGIFVIVAGFNAGKFGGDYWVIPYVRKGCARLFKLEVELPGSNRNKASH
ncbi:DoxX family protein [Alicyclobacillus sp. SO9]|uniref:DoxX family protein n=1 Tax=Alicyclobacillus sp. SO9 TaxID=2665646 RepID=UPI0018E7267C|nr:DoxX family protein [Alicyclobacillus sp. SO9]QQE80664.1 DoxX family protein [Alicyclobacillus sp. SO9]